MDLSEARATRDGWVFSRLHFECGESEKFPAAAGENGVLIGSRGTRALKNLAGALHADEYGYTLSVSRKVKMEIPAKIGNAGLIA